MELVKGGWTLTLGLALSISACAYSITSTFDPWTVDGGLDSSASGAVTSTDLPMSASSVSGSSNGAASQTTYDAGLAIKSDAAVVADAGSAFDVTGSRVVGVEASVPCTAQSCSNGCCDTGGRCQGTEDNACGKGGGSCVDCTLTGGTCKANACTGSPPSPSSSSSSSGGRGGGINLLGCNPIICWYGCCQDDGTCAVSSNTSCGTLGSQCVACTASQTCLVGACL